MSEIYMVSNDVLDRSVLVRGAHDGQDAVEKALKYWCVNYDDYDPKVEDAEYYPTFGKVDVVEDRDVF